MADDEYQLGRGKCYICQDECPHLLEKAHLVPNRMGGEEDEENIVELCPTCHTAVDGLFDYDYYDRLFRIWQKKYK